MDRGGGVCKNSVVAESTPTHGSLPRIGDRIDKYEVCGDIDSGGMSVIYLVKLAGVGGFQKLLAMKIILPSLAREERFKDMFLDEARILSLIQHPNVVPVHDVGETSSGLLYMVMDLLRGRSLARLIKKTRKLGQKLPRNVALSILADAAEGLHAAHETRLPDGKPANVVHRDVSPQNIHVSWDGTRVRCAGVP
jgi:serine/threonine-protein kinase